MILSQEEILKTIRMLLTKYAPASLDRENVFETLSEFADKFFLPPSELCSHCGAKMVCTTCGDIDVDTTVTVRVNGIEIYDD